MTASNAPEERNMPLAELFCERFPMDSSAASTTVSSDDDKRETNAIAEEGEEG